MRRSRALLVLAGLSAAVGLTPGAFASAARVDPRLTVTAALHSDTSQPLRELVGRWAPTQGIVVAEPSRAHMTVTPGLADPVQQTATTIPPRVTVAHNYVGLGDGFDPTFTVQAIPPDTVGAAGRTQYVQWVNSSFAILDKATGRHLLGPTAGNVLWKGFGTECEKQNSGDPLVNYDRAADRWVLQQFVSSAPYMQCVAVSKTPDATGPYYRYAFPYTDFNDYPKAGVWSNSYVETYHMFPASGSTYPEVCALDRSAMLHGRAAHQACFALPAGAPLLLPADVDGSRSPRSDEAAPLLGLGTNALELYGLQVDWSHPRAAKLSGPKELPVAAFNPACGLLYQVANREAAPCAPQPVTGVVGQAALVGLDVLSDRPMYRLAWRRLANGQEVMLVNHAVDALPTAAVGLRWYDLRRRGSADWAVNQQGTFLPDRDSRWMGSAAMDKHGGIAVAYSVSGLTTTFPSIRAAGRLPSDPPGQLSQETVIAQGFGEQATASNVARWGDYSDLSVDPVDDCTLWYTTEFMATVGVFDWSTKIAALRLPGC